MEAYANIKSATNGRLARIILNRPQVHHALNAEMIREITRALVRANEDNEVVVILLSAPGPHFCAGADLEWMRSAASQERSVLEKESRELATMYQTLASSTKTTIAAVQGKTLGGAIGLVAAADVVIAEESSVFAFSEVRLGLVPATIAPHVIRKTGRSRSLAWMLSGMEFGSAEAQQAGLVHHRCADGKIQAESDVLIQKLLQNGPEAMKGIKELYRRMEKERAPEVLREISVDTLLKFRLSSEGQEGMTAFLEKRKPGWRTDA